MRYYRFVWVDCDRVCVVHKSGCDLRKTREEAKRELEDIMARTEFWGQGCDGPFHEILEREVRLKDRITYWEEAVGSKDIDDYIKKSEVSQ